MSKWVLFTALRRVLVSSGCSQAQLSMGGSWGGWVSGLVEEGMRF